MPRQAAIAVGCGIVAALFYLSVLSGANGALILVYLAQFPLFLAGLSLGAGAGVIAAGAGAAVTLLVAGALSALFFLAVDALPATLLVQRALLWRSDEAGRVWHYPAGRLAMWLGGLGVAAIAAAVVWFADRPGGLPELSQQLVAASLGRMLELGDEAERQIARWFAGFAVLSWLVMVALNGVLAQGVLARFGWNRRPSPDIAELELPRWAPAALAAAVLLAAAPGTLGYFGANAWPALVLPFVFAGLAVVHVLARRSAARGPLLIGFYFVLVVFWWSIPLVAALGFLEQWVGLRRRLAFAAAGRGDE
jgi:Predicted membrane protein (DUF2232)